MTRSERLDAIERARRCFYDHGRGCLLFLRDGMAVDEDRYSSVDEIKEALADVAAVLNVKPQSLRLRRMRGGGRPFIRLTDSPTSRAYYPEAECLAWPAARPRRTSTAEEKRNASKG